MKTVSEILTTLSALTNQDLINDFFDNDTDGYYICPIMDWDEFTGVEVGCGNIWIDTSKSKIYHQIDDETIKICPLPKSFPSFEFEQFVRADL